MIRILGMLSPSGFTLHISIHKRRYMIFFFILTKDTSMDSKLKSCNRKEFMFAFMTWVVVRLCTCVCGGH
jgi:hypothetical protein